MDACPPPTNDGPDRGHAGMNPAPRPRVWQGVFACVAIASLIVAAMLWWRPPVEARGEYLAFGTRVSVQLRAPDRESATRALAAMGPLLIHDHRAWHPWEPSDVTRLNAALAEGRPHRVERDIASLIHAATIGDTRSDGLFNPAAGRLIAAWGFHTSQYPVRTAAPTERQVAALRAAMPRMRDVRVDAQGIVTSRRREVQLDFNGLAEGYAAAQMRQLLRAEGVDDALLYVGGFVLAMGRDGRRPWTAGVRGPGGVLGAIDLRDGEALSSSGDYQRRRTGTRQNGGHIVDTRSGRPERASAAASVIATDPVLADMAATALMVAGPTGFDAMVRRMRLNCALLVTHEGEVLITPALRERLRLHDGTAAAAFRLHPGAGEGGCDATGGLPPIPIELPPAPAGSG